MSYSIDSIDYATLAEAMLPSAKAHMRVDFDDDDESILQYLAWAMGLVEQATGQQIGTAIVSWTPDGFFNGFNTVMLAQYPFPVQPVASFTVSDSDGVDTSSQYKRVSSGFTLPVNLARIDGALFPVGTAVAFVSGYADAAKIMPNLQAGIYRVAAMLYENRESITQVNVEEMPLWLNDLLVGTWIPRA